MGVRWAYFREKYHNSQIRSPPSLRSHLSSLPHGCIFERLQYHETKAESTESDNSYMELESQFPLALDAI